MTTQEMLNRISELEHENEQLQKRLHEKEANMRFTFKKDWGIYYGPADSLSKAVRWVCFRKLTTKEGSPRVITLKGMTDDEYTRYCTIMRTLCDVLLSEEDESYREEKKNATWENRT